MMIFNLQNFIKIPSKSHQTDYFATHFCSPCPDLWYILLGSCPRTGRWAIEIQADNSCVRMIRSTTQAQKLSLPVLYINTWISSLCRVWEKCFIYDSHNKRIKTSLMPRPCITRLGTDWVLLLLHSAEKLGFIPLKVHSSSFTCSSKPEQRCQEEIFMRKQAAAILLLLLLVLPGQKQMMTFRMKILIKWMLRRTMKLSMTSFPYFAVKLSCVCLMIAYRK